MSEQSMMIRLDHLEEMASNAADVHDVRELNAEICAIRARLSALESAQPAPAEAKSNLPRALQKFAIWLDRFEINDDCAAKDAADAI